MTISGATIIQSLMVLILSGAGAAIWRATVAIAKLEERLSNHIVEDTQFHKEIMDSRGQ